MLAENFNYIFRNKMSKHTLLVGIVPRKNLWPKIQKEKWYHVPVEKAPAKTELVEYLGFYFPDVFDKEMRYQVKYYAKVKKVTVVKRLELFPEESEDESANKDYFKFHLEEIKQLPQSIPNLGRREIIHILTSYEKLFSAKEINDLYDISPLEEIMYWEMKKRKIFTERQFYVKVGEKEFYCLDFGIFCKRGKIDLECDGAIYHTSPEALAKDKKRNNELTNYGWCVLRFSGEEINKSINDCFKIIERNIESLGGILSVS